jgi:hypothetical protein
MTQRSLRQQFRIPALLFAIVMGFLWGYSAFAWTVVGR